MELGADEDRAGLDLDESIAAYDDLVTVRIAAHFPDATVLLDDGPWGCEGFDNRAAIIGTCRRIADDVFAPDRGGDAPYIGLAYAGIPRTRIPWHVVGFGLQGHKVLFCMHVMG